MTKPHHTNKITEALIKDIPKTDLHLHLDGSLRISSLIDMAQKAGLPLPSYTEAGLKELVFKDSYKNLGEYLHGFMYTCGVMRTPENIERVAYELAQDNLAEGVKYIEVRFAPQLHMDGHSMTMEVVLEAVNKGLARAKREFNNRTEVIKGQEPQFDYGIITCAMRMFNSHFSPYYEKLFSTLSFSDADKILRQAAIELARGVVEVRDRRGIPVVAFDLAGQEDGYPAGDFKEAYEWIHKNFVHKTVHAGEAYGAESIFQAITDLHADRLGHAYYLFDTNKVQQKTITDKQAYIDKIVNYVAEKRVTVEVCLTSNMQTNPDIKDIKNHSFKKMLEKKISVSICTDNRLVSNTSVSKEIKLACDNFDLGIKELKDIVTYGFKRSFQSGPYTEKRTYVRKMLNYFDEVLKKHHVNI